MKRAINEIPKDQYSITLQLESIQRYVEGIYGSATQTTWEVYREAIQKLAGLIKEHAAIFDSSDKESFRLILLRFADLVSNNLGRRDTSNSPVTDEQCATLLDLARKIMQLNDKAEASEDKFIQCQKIISSLETGMDLLTLLNSSPSAINPEPIFLSGVSLNCELLPSINAGVMGNPPSAPRSSLAPPGDPQFFAASPALAGIAAFLPNLKPVEIQSMRPEEKANSNAPQEDDQPGILSEKEIKAYFSELARKYYNELKDLNEFKSGKKPFKCPKKFYNALSKEGEVGQPKYVLYIPPPGSYEKSEQMLNYLLGKLQKKIFKSNPKSRIVFKSKNSDEWQKERQFSVIINGKTSERVIDFTNYALGTIAIYGRFLCNFMNEFYPSSAVNEKKSPQKKNFSQGKSSVIVLPKPPSVPNPLVVQPVGLTIFQNDQEIQDLQRQIEAEKIRQNDLNIALEAKRIEFLHAMNQELRELREANNEKEKMLNRAIPSPVPLRKSSSQLFFQGSGSPKEREGSPSNSEDILTKKIRTKK